jgi:hypothetical protein
VLLRVYTNHCKFADLEKLTYGTKFEALVYTEPTNLDAKDGTAIISLDTKSKFEGDRLVEFTWAACFFDIATLRGASAGEYPWRVQGVGELQAHGASHQSRKEDLHCGIHESTLVTARRAISNIFEPLCRDADDKPIERTEGVSYDHTQHKRCTPRKKVILLLPDREKCLGDLKTLGFDPHKRYVTMQVGC